MIGMAKDGRKPEYLGDGAYVQMDPDGDYQLWITAENGVEVQSAIALGQHELQALMRYARENEFNP